MQREKITIWYARDIAPVILKNVPVALRLALVQRESENRVVRPRVLEPAVQSLRLDLELLLGTVQFL